MKKIFMSNGCHETLKYSHKFQFLTVVLFCSIFLLLSGCVDSTDTNVNNTPPDILTSHTEKINDITWTVHYYTVSHKISSINASFSESDRSSDYWKFSAYYHGDSNLPVKHTVVLVGSPQGDGWYLIEKTEQYIMSASSTADLERVKKTYPSCTQDPLSFSITLSKRITRFEEKLLFTLPFENNT